MTHIPLKNPFIILTAMLALATLVWAVGFFLVPGSASETMAEGDALEIVQAMPEVQSYVGQLAGAGKTAQFNAEDRGDSWAVQVFEIVEDGKDSHTATFNWYEVDKATGALSSME